MRLCNTLRIIRYFRRRNFIHSKFAHFKIQITKCITVHQNSNYVNSVVQTVQIWNLRIIWRQNFCWRRRSSQSINFVKSCFHNVSVSTFIVRCVSQLIGALSNRWRKFSFHILFLIFFMQKKWRKKKVGKSNWQTLKQSVCSSYRYSRWIMLDVMFSQASSIFSLVRL